MGIGIREGVTLSHIFSLVIVVFTVVGLVVIRPPLYFVVTKYSFGFLDKGVEKMDTALDFFLRPTSEDPFSVKTPFTTGGGVVKGVLRHFPHDTLWPQDTFWVS